MIDFLPSLSIAKYFKEVSWKSELRQILHSFTLAIQCVLNTITLICMRKVEICLLQDSLCLSVCSQSRPENNAPWFLKQPHSLKNLRWFLKHACSACTILSQRGYEPKKYQIWDEHKIGPTEEGNELNVEAGRNGQ
jgi:hypothetical protein